MVRAPRSGRNVLERRLPDADRRVAGIKINYTDGAGNQPVGRTSWLRRRLRNHLLLDTDTDNPRPPRIPGRSSIIESVGITLAAGAINIGTMILNERNRLDWRGSVQVSGEAEDEYGNKLPAALIRAGDRIVISDSGDTTERTIVSTSYDHSSLTCTASIGATPDSLGPPRPARCGHGPDRPMTAHNISQILQN